MSHIVVLGKGAKLNSAGQVVEVPKALEVWSSKFEREVGDRIKYNNEEWIVMSSGIDTMEEGYEIMRGMSSLYVSKGLWRGRVSRASRF